MAQLHIFIKGDMVVIDGIYHVMNITTTQLIEG